MNISAALERAAVILRDADVPEPRRQASSLLMFVLQRDAAFLIAHPEYTLSGSEQSDFESYVHRRANHEPFQYIVRRQEFYGLEFEVSPDVLIPRPETELLVEAAIEHLGAKASPCFCEIGVGSGCISVSVLHELPGSIALACDVSDGALALARRNAATHNVDGRIDFRLSDIFENVPELQFDAILSNPPYVPERDFESLQAEVRDFEPTIALTAGEDGLSIIERIIAEAPSRLVDGGALIMEIGFNQMASVERLINIEQWKGVDFLPDLQNIPRIVLAKK